MSIDKRIIELEELRCKLRKTDYVTDKLMLGVLDYVLRGDKTAVVALCNEYNEVLVEREDYRSKINELLRDLHSNKPKYE